MWGERKKKKKIKISHFPLHFEFVFKLNQTNSHALRKPGPSQHINI